MKTRSVPKIVVMFFAAFGLLALVAPFFELGYLMRQYGWEVVLCCIPIRSDRGTLLMGCAPLIGGILLLIAWWINARFSTKQTKP